jgi:hypothetical protein
MTLDELLKQNTAWLEQARKRQLFDKVDAKAVNFPEEQRARRMAELKARIDDLSRRKEESATSYDRAIALEKAELDRLEKQVSPAAPQTPVKPRQTPKPRETVKPRTTAKPQESVKPEETVKPPETAKPKPTRPRKKATAKAKTKS